MHVAVASMQDEHRDESPLRVLVIEDDPDLRPTIADLLSLEGFSVATAAHGAAALASLTAANELPDVILLDWLMPVMSGGELLDALEKDARLGTIPVVVLSGARGLARLPCERAQVVRTLSKPFAIEPMIDALREAGGRRR
jgi:CheY-like chemotaxis protein